MASRESAGRRALRAAYYAGGAVATVAGLDTVLRGARAVAGALFGAGLARAAGWAAAGRPTRAQLGLLAVELGAPPVVVAWQARL
jgi:hypothetical protein